MPSKAADAAAPFIPLSEPVIAGNEWRYVEDCLTSGWVSSVGAYVNRFEREVAAYTGAGSAVAVVNGTAAIHTALLAVGVEPGDEVLVSTLTFAAPVNAIKYCGAHPVLMDADPTTWQMDAGKVERFLSSECEDRNGVCINLRSGRRVRAIMPVHILGLACEIDTIVASARRHGLRIVEDATEALGVRYRGRHVGTFGDAGTFSFNGNKIITTGGGGMIVTDDPALEARARYLTTQAKDDPIEYFHKEIGYNYRLTNVAAAIGVAQLEQIDGFIARKRQIAGLYARELSRLPGVVPMPMTPHTESNAWLYTILLAPGTTLAARQEVVRGLNARGIGSRPLWHTIHDLPPFAGDQAFAIEHAVDLYTRAVSLPSGARLSDDDVRRVVAGLEASLPAR